MNYFSNWKPGPFFDRVLTVVVGAFVLCVSKEIDGGATLASLDWGHCLREALFAGIPLGASWDFLKFRDYKMGAER